MDIKNKILIGKVVAPQGLHGEVRVQTFTESPEDLKSLDIDGVKLTFVRTAAPDVAIVKIDGVGSRTAAENIRGKELFIMRDTLPALSDGEYYQTDLIGMRVNENGVDLGLVIAMHNFGGGDIMEVESGEMIAFKNAAVDMQNRIINLG